MKRGPSTGFSLLFIPKCNQLNACRVLRLSVTGSSGPPHTALRIRKCFLILSRNLRPWAQGYTWEHLEPGLTPAGKQAPRSTPPTPSSLPGVYLLPPTPNHSSCEVTCLRSHGRQVSSNPALLLLAQCPVPSFSRCGSGSVS